MGLRKLQEAMADAAKETASYMAQEAVNPTPKEPVQAIEFASPFGDVESIPDSEFGIETQADLRRLVSGESETTIEAVS
jgi:hypothetical protein